MKRMKVYRRKRRTPSMSFASTSDIAFLLIIFFALAGKFTKTSEKQVNLPTVNMGEPTQLRDIEVVVTKEGLFFVNGSKVEADGLKDELEAYITEDLETEARTVVLRADRDASYGAVSAAIEAVNQADGYLELAVNHKD